MHEGLTFRRYDSRDTKGVLELHEWAMRDAGANPADIPGTEDLEGIETAYFDNGGEFLVGIHPEQSHDRIPETFDGALVAMGGFLPNEAGHADERTVPGGVELHRMRVAPPLQGDGYGKALLAALEARIDPDRFECILATTSKRQRRALAFYPAAGYEEVAQSTFDEYELVHFEKPLD